MILFALKRRKEREKHSYFWKWRVFSCTRFNVIILLLKCRHLSGQHHDHFCWPKESWPLGNRRQRNQYYWSPIPSLRKRLVSTDRELVLLKRRFNSSSSQLTSFFSWKPRFHLYYCIVFLRPISIYTRVFSVVFCFVIDFCLPFQWYHPLGRYANSNNRYAICNPDNKEEPNNWLRSYVIEVGDIGKLDVTFTYYIKACQPSATFCKEYFHAYVWESNTSVTPQQIPNPINDSQLYRQFANITRQSDQETILTVPLKVTRKYIVLGIRDQGGCRTLFSVKISYKVCIGETLEDSLVLLPLTISLKESTPVQGSCAKNSRQIVPGNLSVLCDSDGEWNTSRLESRCVCKEDMENRGGVCFGMTCPKNTFALYSLSFLQIEWIEMLS